MTIQKDHMNTKTEKLPRLCIDEDFKTDMPINLSLAHLHYLKTVLRRQEGDSIRIFNGIDGEYIATLSALKKKDGTATLSEKIKDQPAPPKPVHLLFAPIKKSRLEILIEKSVELGVTDLHPIMTQRTENRKLNAERIHAQIIEASEQCERMDIPKFHDPKTLNEIIKNWTLTPTIFWAQERENNIALNKCQSDAYSFLIGPEGGFTDEEIKTLTAQKHIKPISLGDRIYRTETASMLCLSQAALRNLSKIQK